MPTGQSYRFLRTAGVYVNIERPVGASMDVVTPERRPAPDLGVRRRGFSYGRPQGRRAQRDLSPVPAHFRDGLQVVGTGECGRPAREVESAGRVFVCARDERKYLGQDLGGKVVRRKGRGVDKVREG